MEHRRHPVIHHVNRIGWLSAAIMGANDGIVSIASLLVGVAAADIARSDILIAGVAGLVAGAMSMAAGEYVSVSSQSDTEQADIAREKREQLEDPVGELEELADIYRSRGLSDDLAHQVARQLMARDALAAHTRDELGIFDVMTARPIQAATSALTFALGAFLPLLMVLVAPVGAIIPAVAVAALIALSILGALGARAGGANVLRGSVRVTFWGAFAMVLTAMIGNLFGAVL